MSLQENTLLQKGKYKIIRTLGNGASGITYLAKGKMKVTGPLGEMEVTADVAIKEFFMADYNTRKPDGSSVGGMEATIVHNYRRKFRKEAENLSRMNHPNIVKVLEVFDENNTTYYVMEYLSGGSLDSYILQQGHLQEKETFDILHEICSALEYMHSHKMLHLDLKPKNIMRTNDGHIKLIDFGLSKQYDDNGEPESSTTLGLGTPGYAPLEQENYKQDGSFPATLDIYALGATVFKMLTGKTPPKASEVLNEGLPFSLLHQSGLSDKAITLIKTAMAPIKRNRYQTVNAFHRMIDSNLFATTNKKNSITDDTVYDEQTDICPEIPNSTMSKEAADTNWGNKILAFAKENWIFILISFIIAGGIFYYSNRKPASTPTADITSDSISKTRPTPHKRVETTVERVPSVEATPNKLIKNIPTSQPVKVKTDDEKYSIAINNGDWQTVRELADNGYVKAYIPLANHYLKNPSTHHLADKYAQKAKLTYPSEANEIIGFLRASGYYD